MQKSTHIRFADHVEGRSDDHTEGSHSKSEAQTLALAQENSSIVNNIETGLVMELDPQIEALPIKRLFSDRLIGAIKLHASTIPFFKTPQAGPISRTLENAHSTSPPLLEGLKRFQKE
ncbi:MAG: hypothetical protein K2X50_09080 [Gammaproteobacteria bacterium]|nr:hypothetical protein [Gammaproteobacteria bacterium]